MKKKVADELLQANLGMFNPKEHAKLDQLEKMAEELKKKFKVRKTI